MCLEPRLKLSIVLFVSGVQVSLFDLVSMSRGLFNLNFGFFGTPITHTKLGKRNNY